MCHACWGAGREDDLQRETGQTWEVVQSGVGKRDSEIGAKDRETYTDARGNTHTHTHTHTHTTHTKRWKETEGYKRRDTQTQRESVG